MTSFTLVENSSVLFVVVGLSISKRLGLFPDKKPRAKVQTIAKTDLLGPEEIKIAGLTYWDGRIFICKK